VPGQLHRLANRDEAGADRAGDGAAEDESTRLRGRDDVDIALGGELGNAIDRLAERLRLKQERRDVAEDDARLREVRDVADVFAEVYDPVSRRRSLIKSRCFRWDAIAARFSSASTASLRRSALRERRAGARICSS